MKLGSLILILAVLIPGIALAADVMDWEQAGSNMDKRAIVEGRIQNSECKPNACYLNFHRDAGDKKRFAVIIYVFDLREFPPDPDRYYRGKSVRVTGTIRDNKGIPSIVVKKKAAIEEMEKRK